MEEFPGNNVDIAELISQLQHEKLLVNGDKEIIQRLHAKLSTDTENLLQIAWINLQQRVNLNSLAGARADFPEQCCRRAALLENSVFVDAKKVFDYQILINYSDFLSWLYTRPEQVAQWIVIGEALVDDQKAFSAILQSIVAGFYGSLLLPKDTSLMLNLLQYLAKLQLLTTDNPRRLLKQRSCAFSQMYFLFHEGLISAKLFLISALQTPILKLIAASDCYLDIDPSKTFARLSQSERLEKFGVDGTEEYKTKVAQYRKWTVKTLSELTKIFISSLQDNVYCFPSTLAWLIRQIANMISKSFNPNSKEINAISTDLVFTLFICPAIIQPAPYGICDAPISETARHNLIQVGRILQMLALLKFETPDQKLMDLYKLFEDDCISNILDVILNNVEQENSEILMDNVPGVRRNIALFTEQELYNLIIFFKKAQNSIQQDQTIGQETSTDYCSNNGDNATSLPNDPLIVLLNKLPTENEALAASAAQNNNNSPTKKQIVSSKKGKSHSFRSQLSNGEVEDCCQTINVIVIPLHPSSDEHIGLLSEKKVLAMNEIEVEQKLIDVDAVDSGNEPELVVTSGHEKRTRFSHNDEGSIGNTSDNLEVISEAASNHSVTSSIELENEDQNDNDNLSDMVSANVSGRGSPNISGRDTPSSQVTENEDNRPLVEARQPYLQQPQPPLLSKQIRSEIDDKFCKFEIKKLLQGDETISIISDTWSTDVLASDSETIDAGERPDAQNFSPIIEQPGHLDVSETQSESAWSTDVLASDTERLTEVDNDDIVSVAPSDDTASIARSDDAASVAPSERSELDEHNLNDRRLSTASSSNHYMGFQSSQNNSPSAFQEYRRIDVSIRRESMPNYPSSKPIPPDQQPQELPIFPSDTQMLRPLTRNCLDLGKRDAIILDQKSDIFNAKRPILCDISNNLEMAGPSGIKNSDGAEVQKYEDIKTDMQLSNTSLNSSSSGSSSNSSEQKGNGGHMEESWKNKIWLNGSESSLNIISSVTESASKKLSIQRSKPSPSTGAIPKSISFDMSAEKGDKEMDEDQKSKRGGFFGKLRMNFRHRRGKSLRGLDEYSNGSRFDGCEDDARFRKPDFGKNTAIVSLAATESSEDILAKYRTKSTNENGSPVTNSSVKTEKPEIEETPLHNLDVNMNATHLFVDTKKKLRLVLSNSKTRHFKIKKDGKKHVKKDLESFLQIELAKARDLKQWSIAARVAEALRCVRLLDIAGFNKLCEDLKIEYANRSVYLQYLLKSKQILLSSQAFLIELFEQVRREQELCASFLVSVCVGLFLEKHEVQLHKFCEEFRTLTLVDEKNDLLAMFLNNMFSTMRLDSLWHGASDEQIQLAQVAIERQVMTEVYTQALYPNGDGDRHRDSLLNEHLKKLSCTITPGHKYLMINKMYQNECPWLPAQEALQAMAAYRTPREKVICVSRCASAIMDLLSLAQGSSTTADDLIPVLVYVIIQANPQDLLSTIQYVNTFYGNLSGEDRYWWTQFCSAVEYTKTMEYVD